MLAIWLFIARSLLPYNPVKNSLYKILMESTCHQVNLDFIRSPSGVWGLSQDVWGSVTYSPGSEIVGLHLKYAKWNVISLQTYNLYINGSEIISSHMSNMPNKMLWHTEHIAYIPMVQKSLVCTWQTCQIECYCNPNIYPVSSGSERVSLHMSNMPNQTCGSGPLLCMVDYLSLQVSYKLLV